MGKEPTYNDILPNPGFKVEKGKTAVVITDPQRDFLSEDGVVWEVVGPSVQKNNTVEHLRQLLSAAHDAGIPVFISPHYYYPQDHKWDFGGALEKMMHAVGMFDREGALTTKGFSGSGADWHEPLKSLIDRDDVVIASPHKVYGPESNDLVLQLRKRGIDKVILAGMSANLCVEAHLRELTEQGFEVSVVKDATAGAQLPGGDFYEAALLNFRMIASAVLTTDDAVNAIQGGS
ncbi:MAG: cysteine hydrolase [Gemmatimonadetes bacterium]|uniref:Cysteine hydrolase n=1 Tax=Candidatus Kutchimonas denitrificans TaxID=3056748 RepID=A0AAE4Z7P2_9BACT|nr:cysteine hydrolase [Gemmatimonadota bacterium]NIR75335.1 cysteine hydrolase [Candidatus Kutchimonas denitrificans]NIS00967.1 cysteine hydrolase [Gemmatimonadota bacterium]NIT66594.1 cysteine hydrolase [Gemmatimonadota bacterium]NIU53164.1 isochorismatase family protein [Gemmatimonadota bacterium]